MGNTRKKMGGGGGGGGEVRDNVEIVVSIIRPDCYVHYLVKCALISSR